jgi:hypothetical protein
LGIAIASLGGLGFFGTLKGVERPAALATSLFGSACVLISLGSKPTGEASDPQAGIITYEGSDRPALLFRLNKIQGRAMTAGAAAMAAAYGFLAASEFTYPEEDGPFGIIIGTVGAVFSFTVELDDAGRFLEPARSPALSEDDRRFLQGVRKQLVEPLARLNTPVRPLHGSPHEGNWLVAHGRPLLLDFETACVGRSSGTWPPSTKRRWPGSTASIHRSSASAGCAVCASPRSVGSTPIALRRSARPRTST